MRILICRAVVSIVCTALFAGAVSAAGGTRYKWRDAEGNLHYSDSLPVDASKRGYEVVNAHGIVVKRVEPAKTAEELAAAKAEKARELAEREAAEAQARNDQQMLAAYPTEDDLRNAQRQQLLMIEQNLRSSEIGLQSQERSLAEMLGLAAELEAGGKPLPQRLSTQISDLRKQIERQHVIVDRRKREREAAQGRFETDVAHYLKIKQAFEARRP